MGCRTSGPCPLHVPEGSAVRDRPAWESAFSSESILPMSPRKPRPPSCCDCKGTKSHRVARDPESLVFSCLLLFCPPRGSGVIFFFVILFSGIWFPKQVHRHALGQQTFGEGKKSQARRRVSSDQQGRLKQPCHFIPRLPAHVMQSRMALTSLSAHSGDTILSLPDLTTFSCLPIPPLLWLRMPQRSKRPF